MARQPGSANFSGTIEALAGGPLDARSIVKTKADLTAVGSFEYPYIGMETYVVSENKKYRLIGDNPLVVANWEEVGSSNIDIDDHIDDTSENPVQNKVIAEALNEKQNTLSEGDGIVIENDEISVDGMPAEDMDEVIDELPTGGNIAVTGYVPLGTLISFYGATAPKFFLACDGSTYNKADYPELANHLLSLTNNTPYIVDGDDTKFKVPDLRGEFIRGAGTNSHENQGSGASVGTHQDGTEIPFTWTYGTSLYAAKNDSGAIKKDSDINASSDTPRYTVAGSSGTTGYAQRYTARPTNTAVLFCIAYKDIYSNPMNDYSTAEKVVGTWIDGKPLYQKTIIKEVPAGSDVQLLVRTEISSMDSFIKYEVCGMMNHPTNKAYVNPNASENQEDYGFKFEDNMHGSTITAGNERILTLKNTNTILSATAYVTMMYTKTTD